MARDVKVAIELENKFSGKLNKMTGDLGVFDSKISGSKLVVGAFGAALATKAVFDFGKSIIAAGAQVETLTAQFKPLLGSTEAAKDRLKELSEFAAKTPFNLPEIAKASRTLQSLTNGTLAVGDGLKIVGDAAAVSGEEFSNMATHIGRAYSALNSNRAAGESLARLQEVGLLSGEARNKIEDLQKAAKGKEAWQSLQTELKKTQGGMEELSNTFDGKVSTMQDAWEQLLTAVSDTGGLTLAKGAVDLLTESLQFWGDAIKSLSTQDSAMEAAVKSVQRYTNEIKGINKQIDDFKTSGKSQERITRNVESATKRLTIAQENLNKANDNLKSIRDANTLARKNAQAKEEQKNAGNKLAEARKKWAEQEAKLQKSLTSIRVSEDEAHKNRTKEGVELEVAQINDKYKRLIDAAKGHNSVILELSRLRDRAIEDAQLSHEEELTSKALEKQRERQERLRAGIGEAIIKNQEAESTAFENKKSAIEREYEQLTELANGNALILAEIEFEKERALTAIQEEESAKRQKIAERELQNRLAASATFFGGLSKLTALAAGKDKAARSATKGLLIAEATANTFAGANKALAQGGIFGGVAAAGIIAAGLANVATITEQKFAQGGIVQGNTQIGDRVPVLANAGEAILTTNQQREFMSAVNGSGGSQSSRNEPVNVISSPTITINGNADENVIRQVLGEHEQTMKEFVHSTMRNDLNVPEFQGAF